MNKKHLAMTVAAAALLLGAQSASAADIGAPAPTPAPQWYVSLFGGVSFLDDVNTDYNYDGDHDENELQTDTGFIVGGAIGTHLMDNLRVELEVAYSENDADKIHFNDKDSSQDGTYKAFGGMDILTFMANLWYDIPLTDTINPYIGGGAGVAIVDGEATYAPDDGDDTAYDSEEVAFAFQAGAGLRWAVMDNITVDVGYRLRAVDGANFGNSDFPRSGSYNSDLIVSHNIIGGVTFAF